MDLNSYVIANAGQGGTVSFIRNFGDTEVFFGIDEASQELRDGPLVTPPGFRLGMLVANLEFGRMALFFTKKSDERLPSRFGGMPLLKAAEMVRDLQDVDGILIQSDQTAWLAADKSSLRSVLL